MGSVAGHDRNVTTESARCVLANVLALPSLERVHKSNRTCTSISGLSVYIVQKRDEDDTSASVCLLVCSGGGSLFK